LGVMTTVVTTFTTPLNVQMAETMASATCF
jgi:hypothetical protein